MARPTLMQRLLLWITAWLPCRLINGDNGEPYLERYFLCRLPGGAMAYLHRFRASDPDRGVHDHPWGWAWSWVLSGGYDEIRYDLRTGAMTHHNIRAGRFNRIRGTDFHRVLLSNGEAWTLFIHGKREKGWGFLERRTGGLMTYRPFARAASDYPLDAWWRRVPRGAEVRRQQDREAA